MMSMRKHVHRLHSGYLVVLVEQLQVACLGCRVATDIDDAFGTGEENGIHHIGVHASTWRVGDDYIWPSIGVDELLVEYVLHVASKEKRVVDAIDLGVLSRINDGLGVPQSWQWFLCPYRGHRPVHGQKGERNHEPPYKGCRLVLC